MFQFECVRGRQSELGCGKHALEWKQIDDDDEEEEEDKDKVYVDFH